MTRNATQITNVVKEKTNKQKNKGSRYKKDKLKRKIQVDNEARKKQQIRMCRGRIGKKVQGSGNEKSRESEE